MRVSLKFWREAAKQVAGIQKQLRQAESDRRAAEKKAGSAEKKARQAEKEISRERRETEQGAVRSLNGQWSPGVAVGLTSCRRSAATQCRRAARSLKFTTLLWWQNK